MVEAVAKVGEEQFLEPMPQQVIKARQDLSKVLQAKSNGNVSIYEHIVQVIDRIVMSCPDKAIERFEEVSYLIKNSDSLKLEEFVRVSDQRDYSRHCDDMAAGTQDSIEELRKMFATTAVTADGGGAEEGEGGGAALGLVQDLSSLNKHVFNSAGIELGEYGSLILQKSIKQLAGQTEARSLRFWGKISGTQSDYYVVEVFEPKNLPEDNRPEGCEGRGTGVNEYSYYVSNRAQGPWEVLPDLEPQDLESARKIKVCFSGNLDREIITNPFYFR